MLTSPRVPLEKRGMRPLPARVALNHRELAEQPLLLLMLALYDAETNILQRRWAELGRTDLYGRLLREFARREIGKHSGVLPESDMERAVEAELLRLSVVAFAMFNRRSQWVSETDLDSDLSVLLGENGDMLPPRWATSLLLDCADGHQPLSLFFFFLPLSPPPPVARRACFCRGASLASARAASSCARACASACALLARFRAASAPPAAARLRRAAACSAASPFARAPRHLLLLPRRAALLYPGGAG